jgi:cytochrome c peroxidase
VTTRNSLSLWNVALRPALFWDGRSPSLELQALEPMKHDNEMDQPVTGGVARLRELARYRQLFAAAFPGETETITADNLTRALGAFERSVVTNQSPYDQYVAGDPGAMADDEKRGMKVFAASNCASCHVPPLFESNRYDKRLDTTDPGRFAISGDARDRGAFRVPTLRNLRDTEPYFHDGSVYVMEDAIRAEVDREVAAKRAVPLSDADFEALVAFLHSSLEDMGRVPSRPDRVPSGLPVPLDGDEIQR